jgi:hypothetical protein
MSRTIGDTQLVDELVLTFTHDCEMPAILPGVRPTGRGCQFHSGAVSGTPYTPS